MTSCISTKGTKDFPANKGNFPPNSIIPDEQKCTVYFDINIQNSTIDGKTFISSYDSYDYIILAAGEHSFQFSYNNGSQSTKPITLKKKLTAGKEYLVTYEHSSWNSVSFNIKEKNTNTSSSELSNLDNNSVLNYVKAVLNHTHDGSTKTVILSNKDKIITYLPASEMKVSVKDVKTGEEKFGHIGFVTDLDLLNAYVYIKFDGGTLTKDEFLKLNKEECDIIYKLSECSESKGKVTFSVVKPKEHKDESEQYTIVVL